MSIPNELRGPLYEQGSMIYGGRLGVEPGTQLLIEQAFERYLQDLEVATATTRSTIRSPTTQPIGEVLTTAEARAAVLTLITASPGLTRSEIITAMTPMPATRCGSVLRTLVNSAEIAIPTKDGPYYPAPPARSTSTNDRRGDTEPTTTRQMQASAPDIEA